jgi:RsiW-degrading membrane proteinase PrsW (M82 family)
MRLLAATPNPLKLLNDASQGNYQTGGSDQLYAIISTVITTALSVVGVIIFVYFFYAGYQYLTSGGNEEKTKEAVTIIKNCIIGLVIVLCSYAISQFVVGQLAASSIAAPATAPKP